MVRLSTVYDSELKEQVFKLRGDEDYARTTKTLLKLGNVTLDSFSFDLDISVDVLRDRGDSKILVYDNDILMPLYENNVLVGESIDWSSQDTAKTLQLKGLDYDVQHNIVAKYMGNNKCSPSNSITQTITREDTYRTESILTLTNATQQFNPNASLSDTSGSSSRIVGIKFDDIDSTNYHHLVIELEEMYASNSNVSLYIKYNKTGTLKYDYWGETYDGTGTKTIDINLDEKDFELSYFMVGWCCGPAPYYLTANYGVSDGYTGSAHFKLKTAYLY